MPRERSPNRDKAFEIYKEHNGNITNREIANILQEDEKAIAVWKNRDKWNKDINVIQQSNKICTKTNTTKSKNKKEAIAKEVKSVMNNMELTDKQRLFCLYYSKSFNATQSYLKAYGCSYETAMTRGSELLRNTKVRDEIMNLKELRYTKALLKTEDILQKYIEIAFSDITDFADFGKEKRVVDFTDDGEPIEKEVNFINFKDSDEIDGTLISEIKLGRDGVSIKLLDKMRALDWLSKHSDILSTEMKVRLSLEIEKAQGNTSNELAEAAKKIEKRMIE